MSTTAKLIKSQSDVKSQLRTFGGIARKGVLILGRVLVLIAILLLGIPVLLLPLFTAVPAWIWIPLGIADVAFIILQFRVVPAWRGIALVLVGATLVGLIAVIASQFFAMTPPITDAQGNVIPGSIAALEKVKI